MTAYICISMSIHYLATLKESCYTCKELYQSEKRSLTYRNLKDAVTRLILSLLQETLTNIRSGFHEKSSVNTCTFLFLWYIFCFRSTIDMGVQQVEKILAQLN